jgi:hypothetical protein
LNTTDQNKSSLLSYILLAFIFGILVLILILIFNLFRQGTRISQLEKGISLPQTGELSDEELDAIQTEILADVLSNISENDEFKGETGDTGEAGSRGYTGDSFWTLAGDSYYIMSAGDTIYNITEEGDVHLAGDIFINDEALLGTILGDRQYTESNYVASLQTITASVDALDMALNDVVTGASGIWTDAGTYIHPTTAGSSSLTVLDSGNVGIGTNSPGAQLQVAGDTIFDEQITLGGSSIDNNRYINLDVSISPSALTLGESLQITSDTNQSLYGGYSHMYTTASSGTTSSLFGYAGYVRNSGTGTVTSEYGLYGNSQNWSNGTVTTAIGVHGVAYNYNTGTITNAKGLSSKILNTNASGNIGTAYGLEIYNVSNSGTIGSTYGVYIGDITAGTQTNTPYSLYASDSGTLNYFAGNVGIGTTGPGAKLDIDSGTSNAIDISGTLDQDNQKGLNMTISADTDGDDVYGMYNTIDVGTGSVDLERWAYGVYNDITNNALHNTASSRALGMYNKLTQTTDGASGSWSTTYGVRNDVYSDSDHGVFYGFTNYNYSLTGANIEWKGFQNYPPGGERFSGDNSTIIGLQNVLPSDGDDQTIYGIQNYMNGYGSAGTTETFYGVWNALRTVSVNHTGYGFYVEDAYSGQSTAGTQYGVYIDLDDPQVTNWGIYETGGATNYFSGNVGIGTTSPDFKLDVSGGLRIEGTNTLYFGGTGVGDTSGNLYHDGTDFVFSDTIKSTGYVSSDGSAGLTVDVIVKGSDGNDCTLNFKNGILTGENCP